MTGRIEEQNAAADPASMFELTACWDADLRATDPLRFPGYADMLRDTPGESVRAGLARMGGRRVALIESRYENFGGTMGAAAGEKIARAFRHATDLRLPVVALIATGGARLQEGMISLIQMGRTTSARSAHAAAGLLTAAVYHSPTTGGVYASWGSLADLRAASAGAVLGFGGPRVVQQVTGQMPPPTSHTAESAYAAGLVDAVVVPDDEFAWLEAVLGVRDRRLALDRWRPALVAPDGLIGTVGAVGGAPAGGWGTILAARRRHRPSGLEWAAALCSSWVDLHGTDPAIRAGLATIDGRRAIVVAMDRHAWADGAARPGPAGFRLAQRAIALADQLRLPILTLIDTPGAEPGPRSEADGIAAEIARTLQSMTRTHSVSVSVCVGEGGSGGALALAYTDRAFMLDDAVFSVIGPEAAAVILLRDPSRAPDMAEAMRITGPDLRRLGVIDDLLPGSGADAVRAVRDAVLTAFDSAVPGDRDLRSDRATHTWLRTAG
ncbi:carboxyl transferase domain-containing protein [Acrocarpospora sp. B8E8]|uniref:carboxyl transferase domain-containing protein n=1 Tax=Acrocarpospora sp. B8E8 TaxID=3153572 RepID=UPI00325D7381